MSHYMRTAGRFLQYGFFVSVLILAAAPARAASVSFFLDQSNQLSDGVNYLSVSLMDNDTGGVNILVKTLDPLNSIAGDHFGIQKFGFSLSNDIIAEITDLSDGWKATKHNKRMGGFGQFDIRLQGKGSARTDELSFKVSGVSLDNFDPLFSAHVAGLEWCNIGDERRNLCIGKDCPTSAYFAGSVTDTHLPIPPAAWLFGSGLIGLVAVARRKA